MPDQWFTLDELEDWLKTIHAGGDAGAKAWKELYERLGPDPEDIAGRAPHFATTQIRKHQWEKLRKELLARKITQHDSLFGLAQYAQTADLDNLLQWIESQGTTEAKIIRLRLAARLVGSEECFGRTVLLEIARDSQRSTELRAWALYNLHWADMDVDVQVWRDCKEAFCTEILNCQEAKVRQWAAYALGDMAQEGTKAASSRTRLVDDEARTAVEETLIDRWYCETDFYVLATIAHALKYAGGYAWSKGRRFRVSHVLNDAAKHRSPEVRKAVPSAIAGVAETFVRHQGQDALSTEQKDALVALLKTLEVWLGEHRKDYESNRSAILAIESVVRSVSPNDLDAKQWENQLQTNLEVAKYGLRILLDTAEYFSVNRPTGREITVDVRSRALLAIADLGKREDWAKFLFPEDPAQSPLLRLAVTDPDDKVVKQANDTYKTLAGDEDAAQQFVDVILGQDLARQIAKNARDKWREDRVRPSLSTLEVRIRKNAASALGSIEDNSEAHDKLVDALKKGDDCAREALMVMGGHKAIDAIVVEAMRNYVEDKYFKPIEDADKEGQAILQETRTRATKSFDFVRGIAWFVVAMGILLGFTTIALMWIKTPDQLTTAVLAVGSTVTVIIGLLTPFFWNPGEAVEKANAEMTKLITAYQGFTSRLRLLGLGFAHAYAHEDWTQSISFLTGISQAAGDAMLDSVDALNDISHRPDVHVPTAQVPDLTKQGWEDAYNTAKAGSFEIILEKLQQDAQIAEGMVVSQTPKAGTTAGAGSKIQLTVSKGPT